MTGENFGERVERAIEAIKRGEIVILVDDEDRENEGDFVMAAELVTPEAINFMATYGRGLICLTLTEGRLAELDVPMMVQENSAQFGTAFTVSIEARTGVTTGISAQDRSRTIKVAMDPTSSPSDIVKPGHIFPLKARKGGVLVRTGQTEGSVDLAIMADLAPGGVICEIMNPDGSMARMDDLERVAEEHNLVLISIADMIQYRLRKDGLVEKMVDAPLETVHGDDFRMAVYRSLVDGTQHVAVYRGEISPEVPTLVRVQRHIVSADVFGGCSAGRKNQVERAMKRMAEAPSAIFVYMYPPEESLYKSVMRHVVGEDEQEKADDAAREKAVNTISPTFRDFGVGAQILTDLGARKIRLLTQKPSRKIAGLDGYGLDVVETLKL